MAVKPSADKFIYITGCDTGFGAILTKKLDELGFSVIPGCYLADSCERIKKECSSNVYPVQVDVSKEASVQKAADFTKQVITAKGGVLHGLVNNAGILVQPGPTEWTPLDAYRRMFDVNVMGTVMTTKAFLPMIRKSQGRIVNVASIAGRVGLPSEPAYCMSKYGVEGYCEVLRKDMYPWGVTVHVIEPGVFKATGLYQRFATGLDDMWQTLDPELKKEYGEQHYKNLRAAMVKSLEGGTTKSELVPEAMIHALTSARPKYRYKVGADSKYAVSFIEKLHESVQDGILGGHYIGRKNPVVAAPKNAFEIADGRYYKSWGRFIFFVLVMIFIARKLRN